jgi:hypothetical protein
VTPAGRLPPAAIPIVTAEIIELESDFSHGILESHVVDDESHTSTIFKYELVVSVMREDVPISAN